MSCFNADMERIQPAKFNLSLPKALMDKFESTVERYGNRHKGDAFAAAVLLFLQLDADEQDRRVSEVVTAKLTGKIAALMEQKADAPLDDIAPVLHPQRPEQVLKGRKKRTG